MRQIGIVAAAVVVLGLSACATTSTADLRDQRPIEATFQSNNKPQDIATCLAERLGRLGTPSIYPAGNETAVSFHNDGNTIALFLIAPDGTTTVRRVNALVAYKDEAAPCF